MKKLIILLLGLVLLLTAGICTAVSADTAVVVKVGVYENEPRIFTDEQGKVAGFWPDIIEYIAEKEGWEIDYVHGTWAECIERLENHEIELMPDVVRTEEREKVLDFSQEVVYTSWSRVYAKVDSNIQSILDLEGKTIAVTKGSINFEGPEGIKSLIEAFKINCTFLQVDSNLEVLQLLDNKTVDAGVVSKDIAYFNENQFSFVETSIIFQPVLFFFAFPKNSALGLHLIETIDNDLRELKGDLNSIYYQSLNKWFGVRTMEKHVMPDWLKWFLIGIGVVALLLGGGALILRSQVRKRTKELAEDVAKREKIEKELRESEEKLGLILETIPLGLVVTDTGGKILQVNKAIMNLSGFSKKELVGGKYLHFIEIKDRKRMEENRNEATAGGGNQGQEYILKRRDGGKYPVRITWAPIKGAAGNSIGVLALIEDIAEHRRAEEEHHKVDEYRELDRLKINLLSTVSHELRTPLAGIKGYTTLLLDYFTKLRRKQIWDALKAIDSSTDRLTELIEHLLDMSRLDAGLLRLNLETVKPSDIFLAAVSEAKLRAPNYKFKTEINHQLPMITADVKRLRQVIDNLLDNAVKYSPEGIEITVRAKINAEELLVCVTDQGMGIPAAEVTKIFDRMYRIEQRLGKDPGGMGLGLSLCKALVEAHEGKIWVESEVGKGSTFYFTIPLKKKGKKEETQTKLM
jgi:PAS domain S-box-containing protein